MNGDGRGSYELRNYVRFLESNQVVLVGHMLAIDQFYLGNLRALNCDARVPSLVAQGIPDAEVCSFDRSLPQNYASPLV
jgi:hypothetical protein